MRGYAVAGALVLVLTACSGTDAREAVPSPQPAPAAPAAPTGDMVTAEPSTHLLDWTPIASDGVVTRGRDWSLTVVSQGSAAVVEGPDRIEIPAGQRRRISDTLLDDRYAVVVSQDRLEERASVATVVDLTTGVRTTLDARSTPPTVNGGSWSMYDGTLVYPTYGPGRSYCLASVDLASGRGTLGYCAPARHGHTRVHLTADGATILTFDDGRPSCRTPALLSADLRAASPLPGPEECAGWDAVAVPGGAVWSEPVREQQIETGDYFATHAGRRYALGEGTSGALVRCGDSAYFSQDSQSESGKARLLRWTPDGTLQVVYESPGRGNAFLSPPRCAGDVLTVNAYGEGGDEQVWASVP